MERAPTYGKHKPKVGGGGRSIHRVGASVKLPTLDRDYGGSLGQGVSVVKLDQLPVHKIGVTQLKDMKIDDSTSGTIAFNSLLGLKIDKTDEVRLCYMDDVNHSRAVDSFNLVMDGDYNPELVREATALTEGFNHLFDYAYPRTLTYVSPIMTALIYSENKVYRERIFCRNYEDIAEVYMTGLNQLNKMILNHFNVIPSGGVEIAVQTWNAATAGLRISMGSWSRLMLMAWSNVDAYFDFETYFKYCIRDKAREKDYGEKIWIDTHNVLTSGWKPEENNDQFLIVYNDIGTYVDKITSDPVHVVNREHGMRRLIIVPKQDYHMKKIKRPESLHIGTMRLFLQRSVSEFIDSDVEVIYISGVTNIGKYYFIGFDQASTLIGLKVFDGVDYTTLSVTAPAMFVMRILIETIWRYFTALRIGRGVLWTDAAVPIPLPIEVTRRLCVVDNSNISRESVGTVWQMLDIFGWLIYTCGLPEYLFKECLTQEDNHDIDFTFIWDCLYIEKAVFFLDYEVMALVKRMYTHPDEGRVFIGPEAYDIITYRNKMLPTELTGLICEDGSRQLSDIIAKYEHRLQVHPVHIKTDGMDKPWDTPVFKRFMNSMYQLYPALKALRMNNGEDEWTLCRVMKWIEIDNALTPPPVKEEPRLAMKLNESGLIVAEIPKVVLKDFFYNEVDKHL